MCHCLAVPELVEGVEGLVTSVETIYDGRLAHKQVHHKSLK